MPRLTDPGAEARRVALVQAAIALRKPWLESTGPKSMAGKRAVAKNRLRHGAGSLAFRAAMAYCDVVSNALVSERAKCFLRPGMKIESIEKLAKAH